jgi:plasmid maintenance system antidote protein VapI
MNYKDGTAIIPGNIKPGQDVYMINDRNKSEISRRWVTSIVIDEENDNPKIYVRRHGYFTKKDLGVRIFLTPQDAFNALVAKGYLSPEEAREKGEAKAVGNIINAMITEKYGHRLEDIERCARDAGLSTDVIFSIKNGRQRHTVKDLVRITSHFGTSVEEIIRMAEGGSESKG